MDKHLNILTHLYRWYWDSYENGKSYTSWKQLDISYQKTLLKHFIYNRLPGKHE